LADLDYDVTNGSVFEVAAQVNGVPYRLVQDLTSPSNDPSAASGVPSTASAKKMLPIFIIVQVALSGLTIAGAFWLSIGDDMSKYERLQDRLNTLIPANVKAKGHAKYGSIASLGSDTPFVELEQGQMGDHRRSESVNLASHGASMGVSSRRGSVDSQDADENGSSFRRMLDTRPLSVHDRNSLFLE